MARQTSTMVLTLLGALLAPSLLIAQLPLPDGPPADPALRFEVASIKPYNGNEPTRVRMQPGGRSTSPADPYGCSCRMRFVSGASM